MTAPSPVVRAVTYERDGERCVSCGSLGPLQYQHRAASGMGGNPIVPMLVEGVTSCAICNPAYEHELQARALAAGWKVRRWVSDQALVPVLYAWEGRWCRLERDGRRVPIGRSEAAAMMRAVYGDEWDEDAA